MKRGISRREMIKASGVALAGAAFLPGAGCGKTGPAATSDTDCLQKIPQRDVEIDLFAPASIGGLRLKSRFVRSATTISDIDARGLPRPGLVNTYKELAAGGVGCVITGMMDGGMLLNDFRYRDENMDEFRRVPRIFHEQDVPVVQQLSHEGSQERLGNPSGFSVTKLTPGQIESLIDRFADATAKCRLLGFDGVQMHCAHGYLLSECLNPALNGRTDEWGGTTERRFKTVREIFRRARRKVGPDFALWAKINAYDFQDGGMRVEAVRYDRALTFK